MLIIALSIWINIAHRPYSTLSLNRLETLSLVTQAVTLYTGLFYLTGDIKTDQAGSHYFFLVSMIIPNALFLIFWLYWIRIELLKIVYRLNRFNFLFKLLTF